MRFQKPDDSTCSVSMVQPNTVMDQKAENATQLNTLAGCACEASPPTPRGPDLFKSLKQAAFHNVNCSVC